MKNITLDTHLERPMYKGTDNTIFRETDLAVAFHVIHGISRYEAEDAYAEFVRKLIAEGKLEVVHPTIREIILNHSRVAAMAAYHDETGASLMEARKTIEEWYSQIMEEIKAEN